MNNKRNDRRDKIGSRSEEARSEQAIASQLEAAGARPRVPAAVLNRLKQAAHTSWQEDLQQRAGNHSVEAERISSEEHEEGVPLRWGLSGPTVFALAATLVAAIGIGFLLLGRSDGGDLTPLVAEAGLATVDLIQGQGWLETSGGNADPRLLETGSTVQEGATIETRSSDLVALRLVDNLSLRIASSSRVRFLGPRLIELERGSVYVDSGSEASVPGAIEVRTPYGLARDIGTQFEVRVEPDSTAKSKLTVRVREGLIEFVPNELQESRGAIDADVQPVTAGQGLTLSDGTLELSAIPVAGDSWKWVLDSAPGLVGEVVMLDEFLAWIVRETHWNVVFDDTDTERRQSQIDIQGVNVQNPMAALDHLRAAHLSGELTGTTLVIKKR